MVVNDGTIFFGRYSHPETEEEDVLIEAVAEQNWWEDEN